MDTTSVKQPLQLALEALQGEREGFAYTVRSYSGRGMYGKECLAIVGDDLDAFALGVAVGDWLATHHGIGDYSWPRMQSDSMDRGAVYYWPSEEFVDVEEEEEDEETA